MYDNDLINFTMGLLCFLPGLTIPRPGPNPLHFPVFSGRLPLEWISQVFESTPKASIRRRKLPAELVVWLIIGMGLYRNRPITYVVPKLDLVLSIQETGTLAASSIAQARQGLSDEPLWESCLP